MTTLTMRFMKGDFIITGPDIAPMKFKSRREAKENGALIITLPRP
jgi:hypothetical protein